jgi:hypothetical protein
MLPPLISTTKASNDEHFGAHSRSFGTCCPTLRVSRYHSRARLASGWLAGLYRESVEPSGSLRKVSGHMAILLSCSPDAMRSTPDCRTRRTFLHLPYSCASPCGPTMLVTQGPQETSDAPVLRTDAELTASLLLVWPSKHGPCHREAIQLMLQLSLLPPLAISDARRRSFSLNLRGRCNSAKVLALPRQSALAFWIDETVGTVATPANCVTCVPFIDQIATLPLVSCHRMSLLLSPSKSPS